MGGDKEFGRGEERRKKEYEWRENEKEKTGWS